MNQLTTRDLHSHVTILGWVYILGNAVFLLIGCFVFLLLLSIGGLTGEAEGFSVLAIVGTFVAGILTVLALPGMVAGYGLLQRKEWGRILALVMGLLGLANIPIGTAIGLYTFWILLQESAPTYFASGGYEPTLPE